MFDQTIRITKTTFKIPIHFTKNTNELSNRLDQSEKQTTRFATEKVETRLALFLAECMDHRLSRYTQLNGGEYMILKSWK